MWNWTCLPRLQAWRGRTDAHRRAVALLGAFGERALPGRRQRGAAAGIALPGVLVFAAFLMGVSGWLTGHLLTDIAMTTDDEEGQAAARVAEAALQEVALALGGVADWGPVGALGLALPCAAAGAPVTLLDEPTERAWLQVEVDAAGRWGGDAPQWQPLWTCHGPGVLGRWPVRGAAPSVQVWVADDPEGDGQPLVSANQRLVLASVATGRDSVRATARATVARSTPGAPVRLLAWHGAIGS